MEIKIYNNGDVIVAEGDDADGMYFIIKGAVSVFKHIDVS